METTKTDPVWISVKDMQHYFSIGKTYTHELLKAQRIENKEIKKKGAKRGKRIIKFESAKQFFENLD